MIPVMNNFGQGEEFRAESEVGALNGIHIHGEMDTAILQIKLNGAALAGEIQAFANSEDARTLESGKNGGKAFIFGLADESHLAGFQIGNRGNPQGPQRMVVDGLAAQHIIKSGAERVVTQNADEDGAGRTSEGSGGPFDELREIEEEGGLDLIFDGSGALRGSRRRQGKQGEEEASKKKAEGIGRAGPPRGIRSRV